VTLRWEAAEPWAIHTALVVGASALLVYWNARRLNEMKAKVLAAQAAAAADRDPGVKVNRPHPRAQERT
jgi:hypothetical protein